MKIKQLVYKIAPKLEQELKNPKNARLVFKNQPTPINIVKNTHQNGIIFQDVLGRVLETHTPVHGRAHYHNIAVNSLEAGFEKKIIGLGENIKLSFKSFIKKLSDTQIEGTRVKVAHLQLNNGERVHRQVIHDFPKGENEGHTYINRRLEHLIDEKWVPVSEKKSDIAFRKQNGKWSKLITRESISDTDRNGFVFAKKAAEITNVPYTKNGLDANRTNWLKS